MVVLVESFDVSPRADTPTSLGRWCMRKRWIGGVEESVFCFELFELCVHCGEGRSAAIAFSDEVCAFDLFLSDFCFED